MRASTTVATFGCCFLAVLVSATVSSVITNDVTHPDYPLPVHMHGRKKLRYSGMTFTDERYCPNVSMSSANGRLSLAHLASTGANFVSIIVTQYQDTVNSTTIFPVYGEAVRCIATPHGYCITASDKEVNDTIDYAKSLGLGVMLKLQVDLIHAPNASIWRGYIGTNMTDSDWDAWFASYTSVILHYARIAEARGVELFPVSTELVLASHKESHWRAVIKEIRKVYSGRLTDAANWSPPVWGHGGEVVDKKWWDAVDVIGIDEYYVKSYFHTAFPNGSFPDVGDLMKHWVGIGEQCEKLHTKWNKSVVFTEIGFCSGNDGFCFADGKTKISPQVTNATLLSQAWQYEAMLRSMSKYDFWEGVFWWNWASDAAFGGMDNSCMDPKYKPAEHVLRRWYNATEPIPPKPDFPATCKCWL